MEDSRDSDRLLGVHVITDNNNNKEMNLTSRQDNEAMLLHEIKALQVQPKVVKRQIILIRNPKRPYLTSPSTPNVFQNIEHCSAAFKENVRLYDHKSSYDIEGSIDEYSAIEEFFKNCSSLGDADSQGFNVSQSVPHSIHLFHNSKLGRSLTLDNLPHEQLMVEKTPVSVRSLETTLSIEWIRTKTDSTTNLHPFVQILDGVLMANKGMFPTRPEFVDWPNPLRPYLTLAGNVQQKLHEFNNPAAYRSWLQEELSSEVHIEKVVSTLRKELGSPENSGQVMGVLGTLVHLVQSFRWGSVPATQEEKAREQLDFPQELWTPFTMIHDHWEMPPKVTSFGLFYGRAHTFSEGNPLEPTSLRFYFNSAVEAKQAEDNFMGCCIHMENVFGPALPLIAEFLCLTDQANSSRPCAERVLCRRLQLLEEIGDIFNHVARVFRRYTKQGVTKEHIWHEFVEPLFGWGVNGEKQGTSGAESLILPTMDEFLKTPGHCFLFKAVQELQTCMPGVYRKLLKALSINRHYRFRSFLHDDNLEEDPVFQARMKLFRSMTLWRLGHAKTARRYLSSRNETVSKVLDSVCTKEEDVGERVEEELKKRARETMKAAQLHNWA